MKQPVYFIRLSDPATDADAAKRLGAFLSSEGHLDFIKGRDMVAIKTHFGEVPKVGYIRPECLKAVGDLVRARGALPFLTETQTLYKGNRTEAVSHLLHAHAQGFGVDRTGMPIIMADGIYGDEEMEVAIPGKIYSHVKIASIVVKCSALIVASHFTGHLASGFGCAIKNMGMGCASRKGKMQQHSTAKPSIKAKACTRCGACEKWCPAGAITINEKSAVIDRALCIGCGQCLAVCRFDAVAYNWGATYEELQKKIVEHALGVAVSHRDTAIYINFLTRISKDCDCMTTFEPMCPDIGIVVSKDPVAADAASLDLVEKTMGKNISEAAYNIPSRFQIEYGAELGLGSADYDLIEG